MPLWLDQLCDGMTARWIGATAWDYGRVLAVIVLCGWVFSRKAAS